MSANKLTVNQPNAIIISIYDVLSPLKLHLCNLEKFFQENLENYIKKNFKDKRILRLVNRIKKEEPMEATQARKQSIFDNNDSEEEVIKKVINYILEKSKKPSRPYTPVSLIKDWLWADCLSSGELKSVVYDFVPEILDKWRMKIFIKLFSIGEADSSGQKLFFQSTQYGDLTKFFNNYIQYFKESKSNKEFYKNIANLLRDSASNILFITNELNDALAAHQAGFDCIVINDKFDHLIKNNHHDIKFTNSIQNIEFIKDPNKPVDCC